MAEFLKKEMDPITPFESEKTELLARIKNRIDYLVTHQPGTLEFKSTIDVYDRILKMDETYHGVPLWRLCIDTYDLFAGIETLIFDFEKKWLRKNYNY